MALQCFKNHIMWFVTSYNKQLVSLTTANTPMKDNLAYKLTPLVRLSTGDP